MDKTIQSYGNSRARRNIITKMSKESEREPVAIIRDILSDSYYYLRRHKRYTGLDTRSFINLTGLMESLRACFSLANELEYTTSRSGVSLKPQGIKRRKKRYV